MGQISVTWFNKMHRGHKVSSVTVLPEMHNLNVIMKNFRQTQTVGQSLKYLTCLPHTCQELGLDWILVLHKTKKKQSWQNLNGSEDLMMVMNQH